VHLTVIVESSNTSYVYSMNVDKGVMFELPSFDTQLVFIEPIKASAQAPLTPQRFEMNDSDTTG
jgi:hypothetical protein